MMQTSCRDAAASNPGVPSLACHGAGGNDAGQALVKVFQGFLGCGGLLAGVAELDLVDGGGGGDT